MSRNVAKRELRRNVNAGLKPRGPIAFSPRFLWGRRWPKLKDLHDLRSVIGNDLTKATQSQVRGTTVVQSVASDGSGAQPAIDAALADTRALIQQLSPTRRPVIGSFDRVPGTRDSRYPNVTYAPEA